MWVRVCLSASASRPGPCSVYTEFLLNCRSICRRLVDSNYVAVLHHARLGQEASVIDAPVPFMELLPSHEHRHVSALYFKHEACTCICTLRYNSQWSSYPKVTPFVMMRPCLVAMLSGRISVWCSLNVNTTYRALFH